MKRLIIVLYKAAAGSRRKMTPEKLTAKVRSSVDRCQDSSPKLHEGVTSHALENCVRKRIATLNWTNLEIIIRAIKPTTNYFIYFFDNFI